MDVGAVVVHLRSEMCWNIWTSWSHNVCYEDVRSFGQ